MKIAQQTEKRKPDIDCVLRHHKVSALHGLPVNGFGSRIVSTCARWLGFGAPLTSGQASRMAPGLIAAARVIAANGGRLDAGFLVGLHEPRLVYGLALGAAHLELVARGEMEPFPGILAEEAVH